MTVVAGTDTVAVNGLGQSLTVHGQNLPPDACTDAITVTLAY